MAREDIFIADGFLETCKAWQEVVDMAPTPEEKASAASLVKAHINDLNGFYGNRKVFVKSDLALVLADPDKSGEITSAIKYREVVAKGWLGRTVYVDVVGHTSLALPIYDATVLAEPEIDLPQTNEYLDTAVTYQTDGSRRPIYLPVGFIDYMLHAA